MTDFRDIINKEIDRRNERAAAFKAVVRDCDFGYFNVEQAAISTTDALLDRVIQAAFGLSPPKVTYIEPRPRLP